MHMTGTCLLLSWFVTQSALCERVGNELTFFFGLTTSASPPCSSLFNVHMLLAVFLYLVVFSRFAAFYLNDLPVLSN